MSVSALPGLVSQVQEDGGHWCPRPGPTGQASAGNSLGTSAAGKPLEIHNVGSMMGEYNPVMMWKAVDNTSAGRGWK